MSELHYKGLSAEEVLESRQKHGENVLTPPHRDPWWKLFLEKFNDPIIRILMMAAFIAIAVGIFDGHYVEGIGIVIAILLATVLAFLNEYKAGKEFDILNKVTDDELVKVIRDGKYTSIPKREVVVGEIVLVEVGEEIPADGHFLEAISLKVDESKFTGESIMARKVSSAQLAESGITEFTYPPDMALRGSMIAEGHGVYEVSKVGDHTEVGKITRETSEKDDDTTPLNQQLERLSKLIGVVGFSMATITFLALVARNAMVGNISMTLYQWMFAGALALSVVLALMKVWVPVYYHALEFLKINKTPPAFITRDGYKGWLISLALSAGVFVSFIGIGLLLDHLTLDVTIWIPAHAAREFLGFFMIAVTIIVVAIPEGLAMSVTLSLAYSMRKMTATNNLVRKMHACETIGAATVICSDKTGTLTRNQMHVFESVFPHIDGQLTDSFIAEMVSANSTAYLGEDDNGQVVPLGNPTEGALLLWLHSQGHDYVAYRDGFQVEKQLTFTTENKFMASLGFSTVKSTKMAYFKGAPEIVLEKCSRIITPQGLETPLTTEMKTGILAALRSYQERAMRTLGFAITTDTSFFNDNELDAPFNELCWIGFNAIADPIRPEVPHAIDVCSQAGIQVKIVTGDNPLTAREIGTQIGLVHPGDESEMLLTGAEFNQMSDEEVKSRLSSLKILSRARPMDKLRLVNLLREQGAVVAVTGDGTNDAPALKRADVGLAMGSGTAVAKEASDIILLDDSFTSIVNAVNWGRSLYQNIQRFILFQLTINVAALCIALLGPFIGISLPFTVTQMLWINLIMDTFAALALVTEPPHSGIMKEKPRKPEDFIVSPSMAKGIFGWGIAFVIISIVFLFSIKLYGKPHEYEYNLTLFFATFIMLQFWNLFNARALGLREASFRGIFRNKGFMIIASGILIGQVLIIQYGGAFFRTVPLSFEHWVLIIGLTSLVYIIGETIRQILGRKEAAALSA